MYQGINSIQWFDSIAQQRWENADIEEYCVIFDNGKLPEFVLFVETAEIAASLDLINKRTGETITTVACSVSDTTNGKIIKYAGSTDAGNPDDYYYYKLTYGATSIYSEVFGWLTDTSNLLKLNIQTENLTFGGVHEFVYSDLDIDCYFFYNGQSIVNELNEEGAEKPYGNIPIFNMLNIKRTIEINGTYDIFKFLSAFRVFETNGTITATIKGVTSTIYDIEVVTKETINYDEVIIIDFSYKETDFISSRNEI